MAKLLACKCGDCTHWEIAQDGKLLICVTCGATYTASVIVDPHEGLTEVEK
jgi:hypothetical protein